MQPKLVLFQIEHSQHCLLFPAHPFFNHQTQQQQRISSYGIFNDWAAKRASPGDPATSQAAATDADGIASQHRQDAWSSDQWQRRPTAALTMVALVSTCQGNGRRQQQTTIDEVHGVGTRVGAAESGRSTCACEEIESDGFQIETNRGR